MEDKNVEKNYSENFIPAVHRIGRSTMVIALVVSFLPALYFLIVKGYTLSVSDYVSAAIAVTSILLAGWITEPLAYWPVLGSAGTYMGYLSGNVGGVRFPVAMNVQNTMDANINTARGQIVTVCGIAASVWTNLVLLLIFILAGSWLISVFPDAVLASFAFVMQGLICSMLVMKWNGKDGIVKGFSSCFIYLLLAVIVKIISMNVAVLANWGMAISVGVCILAAYVLYRRDCKKDEEQEASA